MSSRGDQLLTSTITHGEVLVRPLREDRHDWIARYEEMLTGTGVQIVDFGPAAARIYAGLRLQRSLKALDAIQLACAAAAKTDLFITNDDRLTRLNVPGLQFITSLDRVWM